MKKVIALAVVVAIAAMFTGCSSVKVASGNDLSGQKLAQKGQNVAHVNAENWGLYFLWLPIVSGSTSSENVSVWFQDTVTLPEVAKMATTKATKLGAKNFLDMNSRYASVGFLFRINTCTVTGNAVK